TYDLSYTAAAVVMLANSVISAVIQPLFGYLGDKIDRPWFMGAGVLISACGIAAMGFASSYWLIVVCALVTGIGVAFFHPEGGKLANVVAGENKGTGISNFSVGGFAGFAIGPVIATFAIMTWGMRGTLIFLIPAVIAAAVLFSQTKAFRRLNELESQRIRESAQEVRKDDWVGFAKVTLVNTFRSIVSNALLVFIPLYWIAVLGQSQEFGALMLTVFSVGSAIATFFGGRIADRVGFKKVIALSSGVFVPLLAIFIFTTNLVAATALVLLLALVQALSYAPLVALGQAYLPNRIGFASGISLGVVVSIGGITAPGLGRIGDVSGLTTVMIVVCVLAVVTFLLSLTLFMGRGSRDGIGNVRDGIGNVRDGIGNARNNLGSEQKDADATKGVADAAHNADAACDADDLDATHEDVDPE
ncbi:MAG: MFS transporter, partial [Coriobacteriia bacterium]|nr:MFS transporter [Coriobacteriia bacterium]